MGQREQAMECGDSTRSGDEVSFGFLIHVPTLGAIAGWRLRRNSRAIRKIISLFAITIFVKPRRGAAPWNLSV
jgi:hypothetical protein